LIKSELFSLKVCWMDFWL